MSGSSRSRKKRNGREEKVKASCRGAPEILLTAFFLFISFSAYSSPSTLPLLCS